MQDELTTKIAADLGIGALPVESQKELIAQFGEIALKAATLAVVGKLSEAGRDEFIKRSEAGDAEGLKAFLDREVPTHEELARAAVAEEIRRFKEFQASQSV